VCGCDMRFGSEVCVVLVLCVFVTPWVCVSPFCCVLASLYNVPLGFVENQLQNHGLGRRKSNVVAGLIRFKNRIGRGKKRSCVVDLDEKTVVSRTWTPFGFLSNERN